MALVQKITPFLWFDGKAAQAARYYTSIFKRSKITHQDPMSTTFVIDGLELVGFNGGPMYKFSPAVSLFVSCRTQAEIDYYWKKLSAGGKPNRCGWVTDRFGLTWQVVPDCLQDLLGDSDREKADRAMEAMLGMVKFDIDALKAAHSGKGLAKAKPKAKAKKKAPRR